MEIARKKSQRSEKSIHLLATRVGKFIIENFCSGARSARRLKFNHGYIDLQSGTSARRYYVKDHLQSTPSTTGAHEIGHLLGMSHNSGDTGIMSPSQDEKRTNDVMQEHINQMMKSDKGKNDLLSSFVKWYETHKNNK